MLIMNIDRFGNPIGSFKKIDTNLDPNLVATFPTLMPKKDTKLAGKINTLAKA